MNELSRRYVSAFNRIEEQLNIACRTNIYTPFDKLIDGAVKSNTIIRNFERLLRKFADLRNLLVHETLELAIPSDKTVLKIEEIASILETPPKLTSLFSMQVETCTVTQLVGSAARIMHDKSFSQLPVVEGSKIVGLLTTENNCSLVGNSIPEKRGNSGRRADCGCA